MHDNQWLNCNTISIKWFVGVRDKNFQICGQMVQESAKEVAEKWGK
jgi:hypothetical protein